MQPIRRKVFSCNSDDDIEAALPAFRQVASSKEKS
jgi:hypothetical protein